MTPEAFVSTVFPVLMPFLLVVAVLGWLIRRFDPEFSDWTLFRWSFKLLVLPFLLLRLLFSGGRYALEATGVSLPAIFGPRRTRNPQSVELVARKRADPSKPAGAEHGSWPLMGRSYDAVGLAVIGESGSAKGQTIVNQVIRHQLTHGSEHLIILDIKPELETIVRQYARPEDRIYLYTSHAAKKKSSALNLFGDIDMAGDVAEMLTRPERSKDPYWAEKAADLLETAARHYHHRAGGGAVSLGLLADVVADRDRLADLRDRDAAVDNVADNTKEWGSIRSNSARALAALKMERVRRMVDPLAKTTQPDFGSWGGRTIVLLQPSEELADRLAPLMSTMLHVLYLKAAAGGWGGGPGTKFIADEAASFMALERLSRYLEIGRGRKVQTMYVLQSRKQLVDVLGEDRADRTLAATELQCVGATSDLGTAEFMERLSGPDRVHYRGPRTPEGRRPWHEHMRPKIQAHEITAQGRGDWTVRHHAEVGKYHVPEGCYYYRQTHPAPQPLRVHGIPKRV